MSKRKFLELSTMALSVPTVGVAQSRAGSAQEVIMDQVLFRWRHQNGAFIGSLSAPTDGWIAVGFNNAPGIKGTHFVMASAAEDPPRFEEHLAIVPDHQRITERGWSDTATLRSAQYENENSTITFEIPSMQLSGSGISLSPGRDIHLTLAWSHDPDFNHHSAWRRHLEITL